MDEEKSHKSATIMDFLNRWSERKRRTDKFKSKMKDINEGRRELFRNAIKEKDKYPSKEKALLDEMELQAHKQVGKIALGLFAGLVAGIAVLVKNAGPTRKSLIILPFMIVGYIVSVDWYKQCVYHRKSTELLLRARKLSTSADSKDEPMIVRQARMKYNLKI